MKKLLAVLIMLGVGPAVAQAGGPYDSIYVNVPGDKMTGTLSVKVAKATGKAGFFRLTNAANPADALYATTLGLGAAGFFTTTNLNSTKPTLVAISQGMATGAGFFEITNTGNEDAALTAKTAGSGPAGKFDGRVQITQRLDVGEDVYVGGGANIVGDLGVDGSVFMRDGAAVSGSLGVSGQLLAGGNASLEGELYVAEVASLNGGLNVTGLLNANNNVSISGNLGSLGNVEVGGSLTVAGTKNFVQPHPTDPSKELIYVAMEGPESAVFLRGTARLVGGRGSIETPDYFRLAAGEAGVTVQFTPRSAGSKGLAAIEVSRDRILVAELLDGTGTYEFDYFVTAKRAGFEEHRPVQENTHFSADNLSAEDFERRFADETDPGSRAARSLLVADGILTPEGKLNRETAVRLGWRVRETSASLTNR